jgi:hypothetical protein
MTTPADTISMSDVNAEFGRSSTSSLNFNSTEVRALARVASGAISMNNLRSKKWIELISFNVDDNGIAAPGEPSVAGVFFDNSSSYSAFYYIDGFIEQGNWIPTINAGLIDDYEIRATRTAGVTPDGTMNTWLNLGTSRSWSITTFYPDTTSSTITFEIRNASTGTVLESCSVTLSTGF